MAQTKKSGASVAIPPPVDALVAAINGGDTEAFLNSFTADGLVNDWGSVYRGRAEIAAWNARELIGAKGHLTVTGAGKAGGAIFVTGEWKSSFFSGASRMEFTVAGDKIKEMKIVSA
jgi:hypothetical protein